MYTGLQVFNLGGELDANSIYSDFPVSKLEMSEIMDCSRTTIIKYSKLATNNDEYLSDIPWSSKGGLNLEAPLTPYQIWFLSRLAYLMKKLRFTEKAEIYMKSNPALFNKARFAKLNSIIKENVA